LVTVDPDPARKPLKDYDALRKELERFDPDLAKRPSVVAFSKLDLPEAREACTALRKTLKRRGVPLLAISAATHEGIEELLDAVEKLLAENPIKSVPRKTLLGRKSDDEHELEDDPVDVNDQS
jgi:GTP-binding protein